MWGIYPVGDPGTGALSAMTSHVENHEVAQVPVTTDDGLPHVLAMRRTGSTLTVWADGASSSASVPDIDVTQSGCTTTLGGALQGDIAEVIALHGTIGDADMATLQSNLRSKYSF